MMELPDPRNVPDWSFGAVGDGMTGGGGVDETRRLLCFFAAAAAADD